MSEPWKIIACFAAVVPVLFVFDVAAKAFVRWQLRRIERHVERCVSREMHGGGDE